MATIKVYKTNVNDKIKARILIDAINRQYSKSVVSIDLEDCDKVLRVENSIFEVDEDGVKKIVQSFGYIAEDLV
ncbi:MAG: hypothetical protein WD016_07280 [Balneolaceae bacterium]